ncbi:hypothetical protein Trydic_g19426 [Trypoxylus dichotomus]
MRLLIVCKVFLAISALLLWSPISSEEIYEDGKSICSKCECIKTPDGETMYINCVNRQIKHVVSDWPEEVEKIVATFSQNEITTLQTFPGSAARLELVFDHCNIENLETGLFESSLGVFYLDLSYNKLTSDTLSADVFKGPYNETNFEPIPLEYLNLAYNEIHTLHKNVFEHTPNLKYLNLEGNDFGVIDDMTALAFSFIPALKSFNIANNELTDVTENVLKNFRGLNKLDISNNDLDFIPKSMGILTALEILIMDNNPITFLDDETFLGLDDLLEISARNLTRLERIRTNTFAQVKKLKKLDLSQNEMLANIDQQAFLRSEKLKYLNLSNTKLSTLLPDILDWSELEVLDLSDNQLFCDCNLYNISQQLSDDIKRERDGPYCKDIRTTISYEIFSLTSSICSDMPYVPDYMGKPHAGSRLLRISLVLLSVVLIVSVFIAAILGFAKWRSWQRNQSYPFASQIVYNPITTNVHF